MTKRDSKDTLINAAMDIILHAGDARLFIEEALREAETFRFSEVDDRIHRAEECLKEAHLSQTKIIQDEANGHDYEYCMLFNHAQDTLMIIMSELRLAKTLINMSRSIDERLKTQHENQ